MRSARCINNNLYCDMCKGQFFSYRKYVWRNFVCSWFSIWRISIHILLSEDGGIKQGTIPVDSTTIYFTKPGEEAYLETIITTEYMINNNNTPATRFGESSKTTYKLYVPEGSVTNVYEFDAE